MPNSGNTSSILTAAATGWLVWTVIWWVETGVLTAGTTLIFIAIGQTWFLIYDILENRKIRKSDNVYYDRMIQEIKEKIKTESGDKLEN